MPAWFAAVAADAGLAPTRAWTTWRTAVAVAAGAALATALPWLVLGAGAVAASPWVARAPLHRRAERRLEAELPAALDAVSRSLRAGASLRQALADAAVDATGRLGDDLRRVVSSARAGIPLDEALETWARTRPRPGVLLVVAALSLAHESGGASARAVEGVAATLRRRRAAMEETVALSAQARASAVVLAGAPVALCLFALVSGGSAARFLTGTPVGLACLAAGVGLDALGWWWMTRLTAAAAR